MSPKPWAVLSDFDGTITLFDVTDLLLERFARAGWQDIEAAWKRGEIGSRACMAAQVGMLQFTREELDAWLASVEIDQAFVHFVTEARLRGTPVIVVSDGLDQIIQSILVRNGLGDIPVFANRLVQSGERDWRLEFPHAQPTCERDSGTCKCSLVREQQHANRVLFIGDGASDFCVAPRADALLAKAQLIEFAERQSIPFFPISDFGDASFLFRRLQVQRSVAIAEKVKVSSLTQRGPALAADELVPSK